MSACFPDTYFFIALLFENDEAHGQAKAAELAVRVFTNAWVLTEVVDARVTPGQRERWPLLPAMLAVHK